MATRGGSRRSAPSIRRARRSSASSRFRHCDRSSDASSAGTVPAADLDGIDAGVADRVADAAAYAEAGEPADPELAETLMFAPEEA